MSTSNTHESDARAPEDAASGKVVVSEYVTLDGVVEAPEEWTFDFWGDDIASFKLDELRAADALLLGRQTYEGFADAWPSRTDETGYADRINSMPKYVVSTTLEDPEWTNSTVIGADVATRVAELAADETLLVFGSVELVHSLTGNDLVDKYQLLFYPVVRGGGKRLFIDSHARKTLELVSSQAFDSGVVQMTYRTAPSTSDA